MRPRKRKLLIDHSTSVFFPYWIDPSIMKVAPNTRINEGDRPVLHSKRRKG